MLYVLENYDYEIVTWDYFYFYRRVTNAVYIVTWDYFYLYRRVTCMEGLPMFVLRLATEARLFFIHNK